MAYYALINSLNVVVKVIAGVDENETQNGVGGSTEAWEQFYENQPCHEGLTCKRTSYNTFMNAHSNGGTPFRGNYAGIGHIWRPDLGDDGVFIEQSYYPSWVLDETTYTWQSPVPRPFNGENLPEMNYGWDEAQGCWVYFTPTPISE